MEYKKLIKYISTFFCGLLLVLSTYANEKPNIILVMTDDMGFSDLGCYGGEIKTPHLDKLAADGLRFTQFYNTGRCCPTRASLLTGLYQHQAGMGLLTKDKGENFPGYRGRIMERAVTIAEVLKTAGYYTCQTGKWHVGTKKEWWPLARGFDNCYSCPEGGGFYFRPSSFKKERRIIRDNNVIYDKKNDPPQGWYTTDVWTDEGLKFIESAVQNETPFFWYLAHNAPHFPLKAKPEDIAKYRGKYKKGWDQLRKERYARLIEMGIIDSSWKLPARPDKLPAWDSLSENEKNIQDLRMATYAAMIDCVDQNMGKITKKLKELKVFDNTLIIFLHDNGGCSEGGKLGSNNKAECGTPESYAFYGEAWAAVSNTPFKKYKKYIHEGGISTPLIAHWPNGLATKLKGTLQNNPFHLIDIMPTIIELAGAEYPANYKGNEILPLQGQSLTPLFKGEVFKRSKPLFFEHVGNRGIRHGHWKLVAVNKGRWELYDMEADRTELNDLSSQMPEKVKELSEMYEEWAKNSFVNRTPKQ